MNAPPLTILSVIAEKYGLALDKLCDATNARRIFVDDQGRIWYNAPGLSMTLRDAEPHLRLSTCDACYDDDAPHGARLLAMPASLAEVVTEATRCHACLTEFAGQREALDEWLASFGIEVAR